MKNNITKKINSKYQKLKRERKIPFLKTLQKTKKSNKTAKSKITIDDVNEPAYNVQNIIKQTILLEEHIGQKNKYCSNCIIKHFLHIIGLSEEAIWLSCENINKYPLLIHMPAFYTRLFTLWLENRKNKTVLLEILCELRKYRRLLISIYYLY